MSHQSGRDVEGPLGVAHSTTLPADPGLQHRGIDEEAAEMLAMRTRVRGSFRTTSVDLRLPLTDFALHLTAPAI